MNAKIYWKCN